MRFSVHGIASVALLLSMAGPASAGGSSHAEAPSIAPAELQSLLDKDDAPLVIDVRSAAEYAVGHIPGAIHIPFDQVAERLPELETPRGVALYCMRGPRARKGEAALLASGYSSVLHLEGGLRAWQAAGLPVARAE